MNVSVSLREWSTVTLASVSDNADCAHVHFDERSDDDGSSRVRVSLYGDPAKVLELLDSARAELIASGRCQGLWLDADELEHIAT